MVQKYYLTSTERDEALRAERSRLRRLRLQQVRQQAKDQAQRVREAVKKEKVEQERNLAANLRAEWVEKTQKELKVKEAELRLCASELGHAHHLAFTVNEFLITETPLCDSNVEDRGKEALRKISEKRKAENEQVSRKNDIREKVKKKEKERAKRVAALPATQIEPEIINQPEISPVVLTDARLPCPQIQSEKQFGSCLIEKADPVGTAVSEARDVSDAVSARAADRGREVIELLERARERGRAALNKAVTERESKDILENLDELLLHDRRRRGANLHEMAPEIVLPVNQILAKREQLELAAEHAFEDALLRNAEHRLKPDESILLYDDIEGENESSVIYSDSTRMEDPVNITKMAKDRLDLNNLLTRIVDQRIEWRRSIGETSNLDESTSTFAPPASTSFNNSTMNDLAAEKAVTTENSATHCVEKEERVSTPIVEDKSDNKTRFEIPIAYGEANTESRSEPSSSNLSSDVQSDLDNVSPLKSEETQSEFVEDPAEKLMEEEPLRLDETNEAIEVPSMGKEIEKNLEKIDGNNNDNLLNRNFLSSIDDVEEEPSTTDASDEETPSWLIGVRAYQRDLIRRHQTSLRQFERAKSQLVERQLRLNRRIEAQVNQVPEDSKSSNIKTFSAMAGPSILSAPQKEKEKIGVKSVRFESESPLPLFTPAFESVPLSTPDFRDSRKESSFESPPQPSNLDELSLSNVQNLNGFEVLSRKIEELCLEEEREDAIIDLSDSTSVVNVSDAASGYAEDEFWTRRHEDLRQRLVQVEALKQQLSQQLQDRWKTLHSADPPSSLISKIQAEPLTSPFEKRILHRTGEVSTLDTLAEPNALLSDMESISEAFSTSRHNLPAEKWKLLRSETLSSLESGKLSSDDALSKTDSSSIVQNGSLPKSVPSSTPSFSTCAVSRAIPISIRTVESSPRQLPKRIADANANSPEVTIISPATPFTKGSIPSASTVTPLTVGPGRQPAESKTSTPVDKSKRSANSSSISGFSSIATPTTDRSGGSDRDDSCDRSLLPKWKDLLSVSSTRENIGDSARVIGSQTPINDRSKLDPSGDGVGFGRPVLGAGDAASEDPSPSMDRSLLRTLLKQTIAKHDAGLGSGISTGDRSSMYLEMKSDTSTDTTKVRSSLVTVNGGKEARLSPTNSSQVSAVSSVSFLDLPKVLPEEYVLQLVESTTGNEAVARQWWRQLRSAYGSAPKISPVPENLEDSTSCDQSLRCPDGISINHPSQADHSSSVAVECFGEEHVDARLQTLADSASFGITDVSIASYASESSEGSELYPPLQVGNKQMTNEPPKDQVSNSLLVPSSAYTNLVSSLQRSTDRQPPSKQALKRVPPPVSRSPPRHPRPPTPPPKSICLSTPTKDFELKDSNSTLLNESLISFERHEASALETMTDDSDGDTLAEGDLTIDLSSYPLDEELDDSVGFKEILKLEVENYAGDRLEALPTSSGALLTADADDVVGSSDLNNNELDGNKDWSDLGDGDDHSRLAADSFFGVDAKLPVATEPHQRVGDDTSGYSVRFYDSNNDYAKESQAKSLADEFHESAAGKRFRKRIEAREKLVNEAHSRTEALPIATRKSPTRSTTESSPTTSSDPFSSASQSRAESDGNCQGGVADWKKKRSMNAEGKSLELNFKQKNREMKKRTNRLVQQLEEVKKKNFEKEKKEFEEKNRERAKEFQAKLDMMKGKKKK